MNPTKVAVITSRFDITPKQLNGFRSLLPTFNKDVNSFVLGGDDADHDVYLSLLGSGFAVEVYPHSGNMDEISRFNGAKVTASSLPLRDRNKKMIDEAGIVIGIPMIFNEYEDSPAWKTIRYAIQNDKDVYVISPNGYCWGLE